MLGQCTSQAFHWLTIFKEDQSGDAAYSIFHGGVIVLIGIDLGDRELTVILSRNLFEVGGQSCGKDHTMWPKNPPRRDRQPAKPVL